MTVTVILATTVFSLVLLSYLALRVIGFAP
jgi:hypothetical protein